jgi:methyl-accepting chemotaxis protein
MDETSASVEELNQMISMNSDNANRSVHISDANKKEVLESQQILEKVMRAIEDVDNGNQQVANQVENNNEKLEEIVKIILEINSKTAVINDIVFQIKLLSFNASVEAARAGEHGKGFAVVAEEVGNLAQSTAKAAQEISSLLNTSVDQVKGIAKETSEQIEVLINANKERVSSCVSLSKDCDNYLRKVVSGSDDVNRMVQEISASSSEQSVGMGEISKAVSQLSEIFQNSQKLSIENEGTVEVLYNQVELLNKEVSFLNEIVNGVKG